MKVVIGKIIDKMFWLLLLREQTVKYYNKINF